MERLLRHVSAVDFFKLYKEELNLSALVLRRDSKSRELEGLKILEPEIAGSLPEQMQIDVDLGKVLQDHQLVLILGQLVLCFRQL
jgi:hypothetical protein